MIQQKNLRRPNISRFPTVQYRVATFWAAAENDIQRHTTGFVQMDHTYINRLHNKTKTVPREKKVEINESLGVAP